MEKRLRGTNYTLLAQQFILDLLAINLTCNYFSFEGIYYMQVRGTAMGANVAPTYANIFMTELEETSIYTSCHHEKVLVWWLYIDVIFLLWTGTSQELLNFHNYLNSLDPEIKFTLTWS